MIPRYAPEWTNHNPSDPGITLIELAAWMTDLLIYRLNQVPDKNYVAFLNLLGIKLRAPRAARALIRFGLVQGSIKQRVPRATQISTPQATEEHTVTFETARDAIVCLSRPDRCFSYFDDSYSRTAGSSIRRPARATRVRGVRRRAAHRALHLPVRSAIRQHRRGLAARIYSAPERGGRDLARLLEWEYWEGTRWKDLEPAMIEVDRGEVAFSARCASSPRRSTTSKACGCAAGSPRSRTIPRTPRSIRSARASRSSARACCPRRPTPTSRTTRF